jgi:hypothetical protein
VQLCASRITRLPSLLLPLSPRHFWQPTGSVHDQNALLRSSTSRSSSPRHGKVPGHPLPTPHLAVFGSPLRQLYTFTFAISFTYAIRRPIRAALSRRAAFQQLSGGSCCRDHRAAGFASRLVQPPSAYTIMQPTHTACDEYATAVCSTPATTASRFSRPACASRAGSRLQGLGATLQPCASRRLSMTPASGSRPSATAARCRTEAAQHSRRGGTALAAAAALAAGARLSRQH